MNFTTIIENRILICAIIAWAVAQVLKSIIYSIKNGKFEWERLFGDGGMPSCHSAFVSSLATATAMTFGFDSFQFALAAAFAIVVMHDAMSVRLESGKQAHAINEILSVLRSDSPLQSLAKLDSLEVLKELLGHTPLQVVNGFLLGVIVAIIYM